MNEVLHTSVADANSTINYLLINAVTIGQLHKLRKDLCNALNQCSTERKTLYRTISTGIRKCDHIIYLKENPKRKGENNNTKK